MTWTLPAPLPRLNLALGRALLAVCGLACAAQAQAALTLQLRVTAHYEAAKDARNVPVDKTEDQQLVIGDHYLSVQAGDKTTIFDFAKRRRYVIDLQTKRYVDYSLYDTAGFRVMEMLNRQGLARAAAAAAKIDAPLSDMTYNEQSLSVLAAPGGRLDAVSEGGERVYTIDGKPLLRRSVAGTPLGADAAGFIQYLRYTVGGHPLVLNRLAEDKDIPQQFTLSYREVGGSQTRSFQILRIAASAPADYDLRAYTAGSAGADDIDKLLDQVASRPVPAVEDTRARASEQIAQAFAEQRLLDAMLGTTEFALMTGETMAPFSPEQLTTLRGDATIKQLAATVGANGKDALGAAIPVLQQLQAQSKGKTYMLVLFEANDRKNLGQPAAAKPMFVSVLRANPLLAGAYKDLGDLEFMSFDMARAWRCWDAGRRIAPKLKLFGAIDQLEQSLLKQHPEYF